MGKNKRKRLKVLNFDTVRNLGINYIPCCKIVLMFYNYFIYVLPFILIKKIVFKIK